MIQTVFINKILMPNGQPLNLSSEDIDPHLLTHIKKTVLNHITNVNFNKTEKQQLINVQLPFGTISIVFDINKTASPYILSISLNKEPKPYLKILSVQNTTHENITNTLTEEQNTQVHQYIQEYLHLNNVQPNPTKPLLGIVFNVSQDTTLYIVIYYSYTIPTTHNQYLPH